MVCSFEDVTTMLRWVVVHGDQTWAADGPDEFICLIHHTTDGSGTYFPTVIQGEELFLSPADGFYTLTGAQAWCVDKIVGLWRQ